MNTPSTNRSSANSGIVKLIGSIIFVILALVALYYLYEYLFAKTTASSVQLQNGPLKINSGSSASTQNIFSGNSISPIVAGGEYSVSFWVYVNKWSTSIIKPLLRIGGSRVDTLRIYLNKTEPILHVRVGTSAEGSGMSTSLLTSNLNSDYGALSSNAESGGSPACDIKNFELQRWVHITVTMNANTVDTYIDGKLARSCVLPSYFIVDTTNTQLVLNEVSGTASGIDGYMSNVTTYNYALAPDEVYRNYMSGPDASYSVWTYLLSFLNPSAYGQGVVGQYAS